MRAVLYKSFFDNVQHNGIGPGLKYAKYLDINRIGLKKTRKDKTITWYYNTTGGKLLDATLDTS